MKRHFVISILLIVVVICPALTYANFATPTSSFGGKVLSPHLSFVTCTGFGTGPVVLLNNVESLGSAVTSSVGSGQPTAIKTNNVVSGLYGAIPFYTKITFSPSTLGGVFVNAVPKTGDWILGRANIVPEFSTCYIPAGTVQIPFPVRDTNNYNTSH